MICAVMQPYLFPYVGYYQLVEASDCFILYDDVTYIKQSYINRNSIVANGNVSRFSLPVLGASSNVLIQNLEYSDSKKILKTLYQAYSRSPYFSDVFPMIERVFCQENRSITHVNRLSIEVVFEYLGKEKNILVASEIDYDRKADRAARLIELSKINGCDQYINSPGGKELYDKEFFSQQGVDLKFISAGVPQYPQLAKEFVSHLSIIDVLMNCSKVELSNMLKLYKLN